MTDQKTPGADDEPAHFTGEEGGEERSSPAKNLGASIAVIAFGIAVMVLSAQLEVPDTLATAPGLLPFLVGASLVLMAAILAVRAIGRGALQGSIYRPDPGHWFAQQENRRVAMLIALVFAYIVVVDSFWFEFDIPLGFGALPFSSFELVSAIALGIILKLFWRAPLWRCGLVALIYSMALANIFRFAFNTLLPGQA